MNYSGHIVGLLKGYMGDLVEQAKQEASAQAQFGFASQPYRPDEAVSDLLALLDDRIESEGMQVGLPQDFLHEMWSFCNASTVHLAERVWLETNAGCEPVSKARTRELTYRALIQLMEAQSREHS
jgi:hypothetical protein